MVLPLWAPGKTRGVVPGGGSMREGKCETGVKSCECRFSGWRANGVGDIAEEAGWTVCIPADEQRTRR